MTSLGKAWPVVFPETFPFLKPMGSCYCPRPPGRTRWVVNAEAQGRRGRLEEIRVDTGRTLCHRRHRRLLNPSQPEKPEPSTVPLWSRERAGSNESTSEVKEPVGAPGTTTPAPTDPRLLGD